MTARPPRAATMWRSYAALDRRVRVLAAVRAMNTAALALVMTFMGIYLIQVHHLTGAQVGWLLLTGNLSQSVVQSYAGSFSDRFGRRPVMVIGLIGAAALIGVLGVLVLAGVHLIALGITLVLAATLRGLYEPVAYAMVGDVVTPEQRTAAFGLQRMGLNLGWAIGPMAGGFLAHTVPYGAIFFCAVPPLLGCAVLVWRLRETVGEASDAGESSPSSWLGELRARGDLRIFLGSALMSALMQAQFLAVLAIYASTVLQLDNATIGFLYMVNGVMVLLLQMPMVAVIGRLGKFRSVFIGVSIYWLAFFGFGFATAVSALAISVAALTLGEMLFSPAEQSIAVSLARPGHLGRTLGAHGAVGMVGFAAGPLLGGYAYDYLRESPVVMWGGALGGLCGAMMLGFFWLQRSTGRTD